MKIPGVDPAILQQIKNQTLKPEVQQSQRAVVSRDKKEEKGKKDFKRQLGRSVKKLNEAAGVMESPLRFETVERNGRLAVRIIDGSSNSLVREVPPERVLEIAEKMQKLLGLLVDELI